MSLLYFIGGIVNELVQRKYTATAAAAPTTTTTTAASTTTTTTTTTTTITITTTTTTTTTTFDYCSLLFSVITVGGTDTYLPDPTVVS